MTNNGTIKNNDFFRYFNSVLLVLVSALLFQVMQEFQDLKSSVTNNTIDTREITIKILHIENSMQRMEKDLAELKNN
jgi:hypothetical protein